MTAEYQPKHEKPGDKPRGQIKSKSTRKRALRIDGETCTHCDEISTTLRMCHAEATEIKMMSGGGIMGSTINDKLSARLCDKCDKLLSTKPMKTAYFLNIKHELDWWRAIGKTWLL